MVLSFFPGWNPNVQSFWNESYWQLTPGGTMHDARGLMAVILNLSMEPIEDIEDIENVSDGNWQVM